MTDLNFRAASIDDLDFIVALTLADFVGDLPAGAKGLGHPDHQIAFAAIASDPHHELIILENDGAAIGCMQINYLASIGPRGPWRGQIEGVHISPGERSKGYGSQMIAWAVERCRAHGCGVVQLTSNKARQDAHRFYGRLGFIATHEGFKLTL